MKCESCGSKIDIESAKDKKIKIKRGNPSFYVECPFCGAVNHIKCRHKTGKKRKVTIAQKY